MSGLQHYPRPPHPAQAHMARAAEWGDYPSPGEGAPFQNLPHLARDFRRAPPRSLGWDSSHSPATALPRIPERPTSRNSRKASPKNSRRASPKNADKASPTASSRHSPYAFSRISPHELGRVSPHASGMVLPYDTGIVSTYDTGIVSPYGTNIVPSYDTGWSSPHGTDRAPPRSYGGESGNSKASKQSKASRKSGSSDQRNTSQLSRTWPDKHNSPDTVESTPLATRGFMYPPPQHYLPAVYPNSRVSLDDYPRAHPAKVRMGPCFYIAGPAL